MYTIYRMYTIYSRMYTNSLKNVHKNVSPILQVCKWVYLLTQECIPSILHKNVIFRRLFWASTLSRCTLTAFSCEVQCRVNPTVSILFLGFPLPLFRFLRRFWRILTLFGFPLFRSSEKQGENPRNTTENSRVVTTTVRENAVDVSQAPPGPWGW